MINIQVNFKFSDLFVYLSGPNLPFRLWIRESIIVLVVPRFLTSWGGFDSPRVLEQRLAGDQQ